TAGHGWHRPPRPGIRFLPCRSCHRLPPRIKRPLLQRHHGNATRHLARNIAIGIAMQARYLLAKASQTSTLVNFDVPAGACDCHTHIHGDSEKFPFCSGRVYTPETALPEEMTALHKDLHIQRVVIVTPSVYGTDNSATLYGMKARGGDAR